MAEQLLKELRLALDLGEMEANPGLARAILQKAMARVTALKPSEGGTETACGSTVSVQGVSDA